MDRSAAFRPLIFTLWNEGPFATAIRFADIHSGWSGLHSTGGGVVA
jgi:hypothetical protein